MSGESSTWEAKKWHGERSEWITPNEGTSRIQVVFADTTCCSRSFDTMLSASPFLGYWVVKRLQTVSRGCEGFKNKHRLGVVFRRILFYQTIAQVSGWEFFDCLSSTNFLQTTKNKCSFFWCKHNSTQQERFFNFLFLFVGIVLLCITSSMESVSSFMVLFFLYWCGNLHCKSPLSNSFLGSFWFLSWCLIHFILCIFLFLLHFLSLFSFYNLIILFLSFSLIHA